MLPVSPLILRWTARQVRSSPGKERAAFLLRALSGRHFPVLAAEWLARREPSASLGDPERSPFVTRFVRHVSAEGPLHGEPVAVKDSIDVEGARTGFGLLDGGDMAERDATIVARVRAAGGCIIGKTKMTELGMDGLGALMSHAAPGNPRVPGYFAGGSSTGTAVAVARGLCRYGLGGDGLGSIRIPAAYCGLVGLKPTHGRLPLEGYTSPAPSMDVPGAITRTAADCALLWQVMAGEAPRELVGLVPERVGVIRSLGPELASRAVAAAFDRVLQRLGSQVERVEVRGAEHSMFLGVARAMEELGKSRLATRELSAAGRLNVALGRAIAAADIELFEERRARLREECLRALERVRVLAMPTSAIPPPAVSQSLLEGGQDGVLMRAVGAYTPLANCTGLPAIAVPCGVDARGRPLSIMFMGAPGSEMELLGVALAVEETGVATASV
jgi:Asp-tRNA(Asn)/Glu-tRNA(Gln) amidotransferase A subunit family amidase